MYFLRKIKDSKNKLYYAQVWENNMTKCNKPTTKEYNGEKSSIMIGFIPDWSKFKMEGMTPDFLKIIWL